MSAPACPWLWPRSTIAGVSWLFWVSGEKPVPSGKVVLIPGLLTACAISSTRLTYCYHLQLLLSAICNSTSMYILPLPTASAGRYLQVCTYCCYWLAIVTVRYINLQVCTHCYYWSAIVTVRYINLQVYSTYCYYWSAIVTVRYRNLQVCTYQRLLSTAR